MGIWTLEIAGKAVVVIGDIERDDADELIADEAFRDDLLAFESEGRPLWDGEAKLTIRAAQGDEQDVWNESRLEAEDEDDFEEDEASVVFLVPVDAPDDEEEDD